MHVIFSYNFDDSTKTISVPIKKWCVDSTLTEHGNQLLTGLIEIEPLLIEFENDYIESEKLYFSNYSDHNGWRAIETGVGSVEIEILEMVPDIRKYLIK